MSLHVLMMSGYGSREFPWSVFLEVETSERGGAGGGSLPAEVP